MQLENVKTLILTGANQREAYNLKEYIKAYYKENLKGGMIKGKGHISIAISRSEPSAYIRILEPEESDQIIIRMSSSILELDYQLSNPPTYYALIDGIPVLFYTGLENLLSFSDKYKDQFDRFLEPYNMTYDERELKEGETLAPSYNPAVVELILENGKIVKRIPVS